MSWQETAEVSILPIFPHFLFLFLSQSQLWSAHRIVMATENVSRERVTVFQVSLGLTVLEVG